MSIILCLHAVSCKSSWFKPLLLWLLWSQHLFIMITNDLMVFLLLFPKLFEKCDMFPSMCLASLRLSITVLFRGSHGEFPCISRLCRS